MRQKAQLSLEYLLLIAALLAATAIILPSITAFHNNAMLAIEAGKAKAFIEKIKSEGEKLMVFEEGSIESKALGKEKIFERKANAVFEDFEAEGKEKISLKLRKEGGKILIVNN
ncbi:MAG: hypothetical protein J4478_04200 [Candidatus Diapherotrites archaeon]|uniref:Class III signal peptide-containing protein n=1 Tax=Candidatus Iainarchaeum sp. TaxID=3101447 RepID=A0A8T4L6J5_9ARCH|nr:hypothetical protein [Candidatus Diapherotrites archaeon]